MKINRNSWHYKCAKFFLEDGVADSLCLYFWQVIGGILAFIASGCIALGLVFVAFTPILMFFFEALLPIGVAVCCVGSALLTCYLIKNWMDIIEDESFVGVTVNYLSAKKNKICPKLEFYK